MMNKNAPNNLNPETIRELLDGMLNIFASQASPLGLHQNGTIPVIVVTAVPAPSIQDDTDDWDEEDDDDEDWDDDDWDDDEDDFGCEAWEEEGACPGYDPLSETNSRCLFLCPNCGVCLRRFLEEEFV